MRPINPQGNSTDAIILVIIAVAWFLIIRHDRRRRKKVHEVTEYMNKKISEHEPFSKN